MDMIAEAVAPPCRLGRRYDRRQRNHAICLILSVATERARQLDKPCGELFWNEMPVSEIVDDVAYALGMWMAPDTRD